MDNIFVLLCCVCVGTGAGTDDDINIFESSLDCIWHCACVHNNVVIVVVSQGFVMGWTGLYRKCAGTFNNRIVIQLRRN